MVFGISHKAIVDFGAPPQLLSTNVYLHDRRFLWKELLIREISSNHQQRVTTHHRPITRGESE